MPTPFIFRFGTLAFFETGGESKLTKLFEYLKNK
jgi:hypothetical protein